MKTILLALFAALAFAGCATGPKIDWAARVGHYTYDQAVLELGPPDKVAKLNNGVIVAKLDHAPWLHLQHRRSGRLWRLSGHRDRPGLYPGLFADLLSAADFGTDGNLTEWKKYCSEKSSFLRGRKRLIYLPGEC